MENIKEMNRTEFAELIAKEASLKDFISTIRDEIIKDDEEIIMIILSVLDKEEFVKIKEIYADN